LRPSELYQKVKEGEQSVALSEKGRPTQALTSFTAWDGADGSVVTVNDTSLDAIMQKPMGRVENLVYAFSLAPLMEGVAKTESTGTPLSVQVEGKEISDFSHTVKLEITGALRKVTKTESE
jgi:hypothetical protein